MAENTIFEIDFQEDQADEALDRLTICRRLCSCCGNSGFEN